MTYSRVKFDFSGLNVLVLGGSRGIGKGIVEGFLSAGADTFYASRNPMAESIGARHIATDLHDESQIVKLFEAIDRHGPLDVLVNSAAINYAGRSQGISADQWDEVLAVNLRAAFLATREAVARMKRHKHGKIVHVSSIAGRHRSIASGIHYVASKAGLIGLVRQFAFDCAPYNIHVNATCPSQTRTEMLKETMNEEAIAKLEESIPLKKIASIEDQVGPVLFLCSDAADYITGACLDVNGGTF
ncbi:MAG: SDR family oxidoreductase [Desulfobacterales bacterium]|nr:SDR family oxidoreductase [Desulfobacterales bacterium]